MSFSLSISGHHNDADVLEVENLVRAKAKELVEALADLGLAVHASFSGASGGGLEPVEALPAETASEVVEPDTDDVVGDDVEPEPDPEG